MLKKTLAILLAFVMVLGCVTPALAAEKTGREDEKIEPQRLTPVYLDSPPYGTPSEYNELSSTSEYSVFLRNKLGEVTADLLFIIFTGGTLPESIFSDLVSEIIDYFYTNPNDPYATNDTLYCREYRYTSRYPDAVKIVRDYYYDADRSVYVGQAVYYILYI